MNKEYLEGENKIPYIEAAAVYNEKEKKLVVFAVNRSVEEACELNIDVELDLIPIKHITVTGDDLKAENSPDEEKISAKELSLGERLLLPKQSWNVLVYGRRSQ
ncbi:MAG: hypothetical protein NC394_04330 [Bacteroides sp.]|nr:hypothetical protein [Bacteroides sp.]